MNKKFFFFYMCFWAAFSISKAQPVHVQTTSIFTGSSTASTNQIFSSANNLGDLIIVNVTYDNQSRTATVTDNASPSSNTYIRIGTATNWKGASYKSDLFYAYNIKKAASGNLRVTATLNAASTSYLQIHMSEYSGMLTTSSPLDKNNIAIGNSASASSGNVTTLYSNELIWGLTVSSNGTMTVGSGFNNRLSTLDNVVEDKINVAIGTYSATFTAANTPTNNWVAVVATFRSAISVLPVKLIDFNILEINEKQVKIDWSCATEINNDYFEIQRSKNGIDWEAVEKIKGAGNSTKNTFYSTIDPKPFYGTSYYRLTQVDFSGKTDYLFVNVITIDSPLKGQISFYPNPSDSKLTIEGDPYELQSVNVLDILGNSLRDKITKNFENDSKITLDVSPLLSGVYTIKTKTKSSFFFKQ